MPENGSPAIVPQQLLDASTRVSIIAAGMDGVVCLFNKGAERMLGYSAEEAVGKLTPLDFHLKSEVEARARLLSERLGRPLVGLDVFAEFARQGGHEERGWTYVRKDGTQVKVQLAVTAIRSQAGELAGFLGVAMEMGPGEGLLQMVIDEMPASVAYIDVQQRYVYANLAHAMFHEAVPGGYLGKTIKETVDPALYARWKHTIDEVLAGRLVTFDAARRLADGSMQYGQVTLAPHVESGQVKGYFSLVVDVTARRQMESALRESESQSRLVFDNIPALISYVDADQRYRFSNRAHNQWMGKDFPAYIGRKMSDTMTPEFYESVRPHVEAALAGRQVTFDNTWTMESGRMGYLQVSLMPHHDEQGKVVGFFSLGTDITARRELEESLRSSESKVMALIRTAAVGILMVARDGRISTANRKAEELFGYGAGELTGRLIEELVPARFERAHRDHRDSFFASPRTRTAAVGMELYGRRRDGTEFPVDVALSFSDAHEGPLAVAFLSDLTPRKQQESRVRALAARLLSAQEEERRSIARELHDDLAQKIAVIGMQLGMMAKQDSGGPEQLRGQIEALQEKVHGLSEDVRLLSHELHPSALEHSGLAPALETHCAEFSRTTGIRASFIARGESPALEPAVKAALYRIAQEALRNAAKHSGALNVRVTLSYEGHQIRLSIIDDGRGFNAQSRSAEGGLGLVSMQERARLAGGVADVQSMPGEGTRVEVRIPLAAPGPG